MNLKLATKLVDFHWRYRKRDVSCYDLSCCFGCVYLCELCLILQPVYAIVQLALCKDDALRSRVSEPISLGKFGFVINHVETVCGGLEFLDVR